MSNIFAMVTVKNSQIYTNYALKTFFKNTNLNENDEFFLIDNDNCLLNEYNGYKKLKIIKNERSMTFAENVNQIIVKALKFKKNLIFLNNDIIFTKDWFNPLKLNSDEISIPVNNQLFSYSSDCGNLKLSTTMSLSNFKENYFLLEKIVERHKDKFKNNKKVKALLMPFYCFKIPYKILNEIGYFDQTFICGAEDVDYRIRCAKKGYSVNFLLDSYLLHFHGKSTWDGGETADQTKERNKLYTEAFLKKWGEDLTKIFILRKDFSEILSKENLSVFFKQGKFEDIIKKLAR